MSLFIGCLPHTGLYNKNSLHYTSLHIHQQKQKLTSQQKMCYDILHIHKQKKVYISYTQYMKLDCMAVFRWLTVTRVTAIKMPGSGYIYPYNRAPTVGFAFKLTLWILYTLQFISVKLLQRAVRVPPHQKQYQIFTYPKTKRPTTINQKVLKIPPRANNICPTTSSVAHIIVPRRIPKTLQ